MSEQSIVMAEAAVIEVFEWGKLTWNANSILGASNKMTFGQCCIYPGLENPRHYHPNCEEILHVVSGHILHSLDSEAFEMKTGDTVVIPPHTIHNAKNLSASDQALLIIAFSSAQRETVGE